MYLIFKIKDLSRTVNIIGMEILIILIGSKENQEQLIQKQIKKELKEEFVQIKLINKHTISNLQMY
jgi:hypothetical protein